MIAIFLAIDCGWEENRGSETAIKAVSYVVPQQSRRTIAIPQSLKTARGC
jgi:hypothetical protein